MNDVNNPDPFNGAPVDFKFDQSDPALVVEVNSGTVIPPNPENRFYQRVQEWIAEGNTIRPTYTFSRKRDNRVLDLDEIYTRRVANMKVDVNGFQMPADYQTGTFVNFTITHLLNGGQLPANFALPDADNIPRPLTQVDLKYYAGRILQSHYMLREKYRLKKMEIDQANDDTELESVDIDTL